MAMTITEKILAEHAGLDKVVPGQLITAQLDLALANDITGPVSIREFEKFGVETVWDKTKVALVPDHFTPNKDIASAELSKALREFAKKQGIVHYWEQGRVGVEHCLLPEQGVALPGDVIIGADS
ncbi:MAG: aconitase family protein, partial [Desulfitobacterium hafniense]